MHGWCPRTVPSAYPNGRSHPGTAAPGGKEKAEPQGRGLAWLAASGSVSPPRGKVKPSRDPPRPASLACNVSRGGGSGHGVGCVRVRVLSLFARAHIASVALGSPPASPRPQHVVQLRRNGAEAYRSERLCDR